MQPSRDRGLWVGRLQAIASKSLGQPLPTAMDGADRAAFVQDFRDDLGHRRPTDAAFLAHLVGVAAPGRIDALDALWPGGAESSGSVAMVDLDGSGPLLSPDGAGIEIRTERELLAFHALSWWVFEEMAVGSATIRQRIRTAGDWLMAELQPDNGTNHPWGVHVFLERWIVDGDADALMYADQMLSACQIHLGRADRLSACILLDGARWLERAAGAF